MTRKNQKGQALISLMFFIIIALFLISAAVVMMIASAESTGKLEGEEVVTRVADSAAEEAILKLLRDPAFTGDDLTLPDGTAGVNVAGGTITVNAVAGKFTKKLVIGTSFANNVLSVVSWKEEY